MKRGDCRDETDEVSAARMSGPETSIACGEAGPNRAALLPASVLEMEGQFGFVRNARPLTF